MHFSENDIERFAAWSGDHNPVHVDPDYAQGAGLKRPIVHNVLLAIGALGAIRSRSAAPLMSLEFDVCGAVLPDVACYSEAVLRPDDLSIAICQDEVEIAALRGEFCTSVKYDTAADLSWIPLLEASPDLQQTGKRPAPADHDIDRLQCLAERLGVYATDPPPEAATASGYLTPIQARVLGLCSYLAGMEFPGRRSWLTWLSLKFNAIDVDENALWYRARVIQFDGQSRVLHTSVVVATPDGRLVASGELQSYVRFSPVATDLDALKVRVQPADDRLTGQVALVCGGSRGLGAELTAALALAGCRVFATCQTPTAAAVQLATRLADRGLPVEFLEGDVGDPAWCASVFETIRARHGRLDILALNACAPPTNFRLSAGSLSQFDHYVTANLRRACTPLATFLSLLDESRGTIVCSSSSIVADPQPGWAHYIALKQAVEGAVRSALCDASHVSGMIIRSPKLLTTWNDSPAGARDAIPAEWVAAQVVLGLADRRLPGNANIISEFSATGDVLESCSVFDGETESGTWVESDAAVELQPEDRVDVEADIPASLDAESLATADEDVVPLEPFESGESDANNTLAAIDKLITDELDRSPAANIDSEKFHAYHNDHPSLPIPTDVGSWHAEPDAKSLDLTVADSSTIDPPAVKKPIDADGQPEIMNVLPDVSVEDRLDDLLHALQAETQGADAAPSPHDTTLDEAFLQMGIVLHSAHVAPDAAPADSTLEVPAECETQTGAEEVCLDATAMTSSDTDQFDSEPRIIGTVETVAEADALCASPELAEQALPAVETPAAPVPEIAVGPEGSTSPEAVTSPDERAVTDHVAEVPEAAASTEEVQRREAVVYSPRAEPVEIDGFTSKTEAELFDFHQEAFPGTRKDRFISRWLWKHVESARRLEIEPRVWLCRQRGTVIAHNGAIPVKLKIGDSGQLVPWIAETEAIASDRREDIGFRLWAQISEELPFCLALGQSSETRTALLQLGWVEVAPLTTAQFVIHPEAVQGGKLSGPAALAAGWGSRVSTAVRTLLHHRPQVEIQQVTRFDERHERLWEATARDINCGVVRDASYLNWKYVDQPGHDILRLELIEQGAVCGLVVLLFCEATDEYPYRHAFLADLMTPLSDERLLQQLVQVACTAAAERNSDALICQHIGPPLTRSLRQSGFRTYEPDQFLLVNARELPLELRAKVLAGKEWFVTPGDAEYCS